MRIDRWRWTLLLLPPLLAGALALRLPGLSFYPFQDEVALELMSQAMDATGSLHPPSTNWPPLTHYLQIGTAHILHSLGLGPDGLEGLLAGADRGFEEPGAWLRMGRILSGLYALCSLILFHLLARRLLDEGQALWATLLLALAPLHIYVSRLATTDVLCTMLVLLSLVLTVTGLGRRRLFAWLCLAALAAGLAAGAKYLGGMAVLVPMAAAVGGEGEGRRPWRGRLLRLAVLGGVSLAGLLLAVPGLVVEPGRYLAWLGRHAADARTGWEFFRGYAHGWIYHPTVTFLWGMGSVLAGLLGMAGLVDLCCRSAREGRRLRLLVPFALTWFLVVGYTGVLYSRYWAPFLPLLCLGAVRACFALAGRRRWAARLALGLVAGLALAGQLPRSLALARIDTRVLAREWIQGAIPLGTGVATLYPLRTDPALTAALVRTVRGGWDRSALAAHLDRSGPAGALPFLHLAWDSAYPALDPTLRPLHRVSDKDRPGLVADLEELRRQGARYYLWSTFRDGMVEAAGPACFPGRCAFLRELERLCGPPLRVFSPGPAAGLPPAELETQTLLGPAVSRPGPELRIYLIPGLETGEERR